MCLSSSYEASADEPHPIHRVGAVTNPLPAAVVQLASRPPRKLKSLSDRGALTVSHLAPAVVIGNANAKISDSEGGVIADTARAVVGQADRTTDHFIAKLIEHAAGTPLLPNNLDKIYDFLINEYANVANNALRERLLKIIVCVADFEDVGLYLACDMNNAGI